MDDGISLIMLYIYRITKNAYYRSISSSYTQNTTHTKHTHTKRYHKKITFCVWFCHTRVCVQTRNFKDAQTVVYFFFFFNRVVLWFVWFLYLPYRGKTLLVRKKKTKSKNPKYHTTRIDRVFVLFYFFVFVFSAYP